MACAIADIVESNERRSAVSCIVLSGNSFSTRETLPVGCSRVHIGALWCVHLERGVSATAPYQLTRSSESTNKQYSCGTTSRKQPLNSLNDIPSSIDLSSRLNRRLNNVLVNLRTPTAKNCSCYEISLFIFTVLRLENYALEKFILQWRSICLPEDQAWPHSSHQLHKNIRFFLLMASQAIHINVSWQLQCLKWTGRAALHWMKLMANNKLSKMPRKNNSLGNPVITCWKNRVVKILDSSVKFCRFRHLLTIAYSVTISSAPFKRESTVLMLLKQATSEPKMT